MRSFKVLACSLTLALSVPLGCGSEVQTGSTLPAGGSGGSGGSGEGGAGAEGGAGGSFVLQPQSCPDGEVAQTMDDEGTLLCTTVDEAVRNAVNRHCHLFYGWRDSCNGCTDDPAKLGRTNGLTCNNISGGDNTCAPATLGPSTLQLFGLNTDGDVNGDDKFYAGLYCEELDAMRKGAPCEADELLAGIDEDGAIRCVSLAALVNEHLRNQCRLYLGWRDSCNGCSEPPAKWGHVNGSGCMVGAGDENNCKIVPIADWDVHVLGINTDGNVNGDDKFYLGLSCDEPPEQIETANGSCPAGMAVTGIDNDGALSCASPLPSANAVIRNDCWLYHGWRDSCNGCSSAPAKWGRVSQAACELGPGADNTCSEAMLDGDTVRLIGINPDGDVDGNDKFYAGMRCEPPPPPEPSP